MMRLRKETISAGSAGSARSAGVMLCFAILFSCSAVATPLDDQVAAFKKADKQSEAAAANILKTGLEEGRAAEAVAAVKAWLDNNPSSSLAVDYYAGLALKYLGDWPGAITFYRKALKNSSLDPKLAGTVATETYGLLLNEMREQDSAYMFMREDGNRLRAFGNVRQYDGWFMTEAKRRNDVPAVCGRMEVIFGTAPSNVVPDTADLEWICGKLESFRPEDASWYEAAQKLAAVPRVPDEYKARMEWAATVVPYNRKLDKFREKKADNIAKKHTDAALAAAEKLLTVAPDKGAFLVANGWGFEYDHHHSGNCQKRFEVDGERKLAQLLAVIPRMSPDKRGDLLVYPIAQGRVKFDPAQVRKLVLQHPGMLNTLTAANVPLYDQTLTVAAANALSPQLARNPGAHAALVRAYAVAGTNTVSAMAPAIMKSELWRFDTTKTAIDAVWNSGAKRDGADHAALCKQYANLGARYDQFSKQGAKEASSQDRMTAFTALYQELQSGSYATPGLLPLYDGLLKQAPPADAEKILQKLVSDFAPAPPATLESQKHLLQRALLQIRFGNIYSGLTFGPQLHHGWEDWGAGHVRAGVPGLAVDLGKILTQQMAAGSLSEPIFGLWLHCVNPATPEAKALFEALVKSPAYDRMNPAYHNMAAHRLLFGAAALKPSPTDPSVVSRELLVLTTNAAPAEIEAAFNTVIARAEIAPVPVPVYGLHKVAALPEMSSAVRASLLHLFGRLAPLGDYPRGQGYEQAALRLIQDLQKQKQWKVVVPYAAGLWRSAGAPDDNSYRVCEALTAFAEAAIQDGANSPAFSIARIGRKIRLGMNPQTLDRLGKIEGKLSSALGFSEIPVDETDPLYPVFKSSAEFSQGNLDSAWSLYKENAALLKPKPGTQEQSILRKLPLEYSFWLIRRAIDANLTDNAEEIVKELTVWSRQAAGTFTAEQDAELKLAYADLMFKRGKLPVARAWYRKVADAREYNNTLLHVRAMLGSINIDRVTKNFGTALEDVEKLMRDADVGSRAKVHYAKAEVLMDQENFKDALEEVTTVLRGDAGNPDALILKGKIQFQMRKWIEASEIELGVSQANKTMVPGETLKVSLIDPTLSISGVGADIEVEVWAKSGDKERVLLYPMGDSKDKFRAEVPTMLAAPVAGDKILQVLGVDEIRFGYSERFRAKMKDLPPDPKVVITIAADAQMAISAGAFPPREGERKLDIEELGLSTAQRALGMRSVRPGNPVYIRVIDPDKSKTAGIDSLAVNVQSSSGDFIRKMVLTETGPYTGEFQGIFPTAGAQAMAFASESAPGRDPNMAVSSKTYPGWLGKVGNAEAPRTFGVDLNDNVVLGKMTVRYGEPGNQLTHFVIQTSVNGIEWMTRARYPDPGGVWDGRPHVSSFFVNGNWAIGISKPKGLELPADWLQSMDYTSIRDAFKFRFATVKSLSEEPTPLPIATQHFSSTVALFRYRALFYQPAAAIRKFRLTGQPDGYTIFLLDGQPADKTAQDPMTIERRIEPGLHEIQVWFSGSKPVLMCDIEGKAEMQPCPDSMFNPITFPEGLRKKLPQQAKIIETPDGGGIDVEFGDRTAARLVRLYIVGFKGMAPSIKALTLSDSTGKVHFPVKEDFMTLRDNQQLEVLPGDQVSVRYEDDVTATPNRNKLEQSLLVAFNTASITASFLNYETTAEGRKLVLEPIRRFRHGDAVAIVIDDADMDSKPEPDVIEFKVSASGGGEVVIKALETEKNSGRFIGRVFPVIGKPARESEIQIQPGGTITAVYRDQENLNPGIPADRTVTIEHAQYSEPKFGAYTVGSTKIAVAEGSGGKAVAKAAGSAGGKRNAPEVFAPRRTLNYTYVADPGASGQDMSAVIGASLRFDVVVPHLALAASSEIAAYVQTDKARKANATNSASASKVFDIGVPGTLKLMAKPRWASASVPPAYTLGRSPVPPSAMAALDEGRFSFSVPLVLGDKPARSFATNDAESLPSSSIPAGVAVQDGDIVHAGFAYKDTAGNLQWKTASFTVGSHSFLDVMNETYNEPLTSAFVGEKVFVRVIAPGLDAGPERDMTSVSLSSGSNVTSSFSLRETEAHSGVFKGVFTLGYAEQVVPAQLPPVELNGFPVRYGDQLTVAYSAAGEDTAQTAAVTVNKGADGMVEPFTKRFAGGEMAAKTSFTLAECFFELAKKHSQMDQESLARREFEHAQKLLDEAIATHRDEELRAHAEYLSGNLAQEYADLAKNVESKTEKYQQALKRFMKIPVDYPKSEFAPKSQYKTALVYEKMKELEIAVEEYVKLAYKYPESEHIPEVMSRLGGYFQSKGQVFKEQADLLREKTDMESKAEVIKLDEKSYPEFLKAALIFGKLVERFPDHDLAGLAGLRSSQNYMRVHQYKKALEGFAKLVDNETYDANEIRSQALFWMGLSYERISDGINAYKTYRRVTYDFPDSKYAKMARGRLSDPAYAKIIEVEQRGRQGMINALKEERKKH